MSKAYVSLVWPLTIPTSFYLKLSKLKPKLHYLQFKAVQHIDLIQQSVLLKKKILNYFSLDGGASGKEPTCRCRGLKRHWFNPWVGKIPWRRKYKPTPVFLPGESHGQRSLVGYTLQGCKELDTTEAI